LFWCTPRQFLFHEAHRWSHQPNCCIFPATLQTATLIRVLFWCADFEFLLTQERQVIAALPSRDLCVAGLALTVAVACFESYVNGILAIGVSQREPSVHALGGHGISAALLCTS